MDVHKLLWAHKILQCSSSGFTGTAVGNYSSMVGTLHGKSSAASWAWKCVSTVQLLGQGVQAHIVNAD